MALRVTQISWLEHGPEMDEDEDPEVTERMFFAQPNVQQVHGDLAEQMA
jgi:hypothetical protein